MGGPLIEIAIVIVATRRRGFSLMATLLTMQDQLAMLRMVIDRQDPVHVEAEAGFAAMVAKATHEVEISPGDHSIRTLGECGPGRPDERLAIRLMRGTAEAYDALSIGDPTATVERSGGPGVCHVSARRASGA